MGRQPDRGANFVGWITCFRAQTGPASQSEKRYGFPARKICVTSGRVDDFWNTGGWGSRGCRNRLPPCRPFLNRWLVGAVHLLSLLTPSALHRIVVDKKTPAPNIGRLIELIYIGMVQKLQQVR